MILALPREIVSLNFSILLTVMTEMDIYFQSLVVRVSSKSPRKICPTSAVVNSKDQLTDPLIPSSFHLLAFNLLIRT